VSSQTSERLTPERCSATSGALGEPLAGTASTVRSWLLLQHSGPWGRDAFADGRHAVDGFGVELASRCAAARVRPLLIRRVDRDLDLERVTVFAIRSGPGEPRVERTSFATAGDALGLDLEALGRGEALGLEAHEEALFLVCTHGRHDPCCVERGRPLAFALSEVFPDATWECSHLGGDRFAANLLAFPHGYVFGRVEPSDGERVARAYLDGRLSLEHLRGRTCMPMAGQFAELALREELELDGVDGVRFEGASRAGDAISATFATPAGTATVSLVVDTAGPRFLTCHSTREEAPPAYRVTSILPPS
jgi:hypothetical protein